MFGVKALFRHATPTAENHITSAASIGKEKAREDMHYQQAAG